MDMFPNLPVQVLLSLWKLLESSRGYLHSRDLLKSPSVLELDQADHSNQLPVVRKTKRNMSLVQ